MPGSILEQDAADEEGVKVEEMFKPFTIAVMVTKTMHLHHMPDEVIVRVYIGI